MYIYYICLLLLLGLNTTIEAGTTASNAFLPEISVTIPSKASKKQAKKTIREFRRKAKGGDGILAFFASLAIFALLAWAVKGVSSLFGGSLTYGQALLWTLGGIAFIAICVAIFVFIAFKTGGGWMA